MASEEIDKLVQSVSGHLEPRDVMDFLYQEHALSEDDMERVGVQVTRKDRCRLLVQQLAERQDSVKAFRVFADSLKYNYDFLTAEVGAQIRSVIATLQTRKLCQECSCNLPSSVPCPNSSSETDSDRERGRLRRREKHRVCRSLPPSGGKMDKRVARVFTFLSTSLNKGDYMTFDDNAKRLVASSSCPADVQYTVLYLECCQALFRHDLDLAKSLCAEATKLLHQTSNPAGFAVEILSKKAWRYFKLNKLNKLESCLKDAIQLIRQDPLRCTGKAAGWIFVNHARLLTSMISSTSPKRTQSLRHQALCSLEEAIEHFSRDPSSDALFGQYVAFVQYALLLLQCGRHMQFSRFRLSSEDIDKALKVLKRVEDSEIGIPEILRVTYYTAMSDLHYRRGNSQRALEYATDASCLATKLDMGEERKCAVVRVDFYNAVNNRRQPVFTISEVQCMWEMEAEKEGDEGDDQFHEKAFVEGLRQTRHLKSNMLLVIIRHLRTIALLAGVAVAFATPVVFWSQ